MKNMTIGVQFLRKSFFYFSFLSLSGCSSALLVDSFWEKGKVHVDGVDNEWQGRSYYFADKGVGFGIQNDSDDIYILLKITEGRQAMQMMRGGVTVWFDPAGGNKKEFGLRYPLGKGEEPPAFERDAREMERRTDPAFPEFEILRDGKESGIRVPIIDSKGIGLSIRRSGELLVYEMKIPCYVSTDHPYAVGLTGAELGIMIESNSVERPARREGPRPMADDAGQGESGGQRPGGMRGRRPVESGGNASASLDLSLKVTMATK